MSFKNNSCRRAFTLLELILVMIIICTMLAIAAPNLRGFFSSRQLNTIADRMSILSRYGSNQAVSEGRIYRLNIDVVENRYWLSVYDQGNFRALMTKFGQELVIPDEIELRFENIQQDADVYYVEFKPEGYGCECVIQLKDETNIILLRKRSPTENFELITIYEDYI